jgi:hypothetical protein
MPPFIDYIETVEDPAYRGRHRQQVGVRLAAVPYDPRPAATPAPAATTPGRTAPVNSIALAAFAHAGIKPPPSGQYTAAEVDAQLVGTNLTVSEKIALKGHLRDADLLAVTASVSASTGARPLPDTIVHLMASSGVTLSAAGTISLDRLDAEMAAAPMGDRFTLKQALAATGRITA